MRKKTEGVTNGVLGKYTRELARLKAFFGGRSHVARSNDPPRIREFRAAWSTDDPSSYTRAKVQERLKSFLSYCHDARWLSHGPKPSTIKVEEPETQPLTDQEYADLLDQTYAHFADNKEWRRKFRALIQLMRMSGLSIQDALTIAHTRFSRTTARSTV